jgi:plasmid stabilization system protein ParE
MLPASARIDKRVNDLMLFSEQGTAFSRGLRRLDVSKTSCLVLYRIEKQVISIVAVLHGRRNRRS